MILFAQAVAALSKLAIAILGSVAVYGPCADDVAALPAAYRPDVYGYELICHVEHPVHPDHGLVQGYVKQSSRIVHLWGYSTWPTGFVLAHEVGHIEYGHVRGQPGIEAEASAFAAEILGIESP